MRREIFVVTSDGLRTTWWCPHCGWCCWVSHGPPHPPHERRAASPWGAVSSRQDESSFKEINNMTVAKHNYRYQYKLASPWWCLTASEIDEDTATHTWLHFYLCKTRCLISSYLYSPPAFLLSSMSSSSTWHVKCTSHPPIYQRLEYHQTASSKTKRLILSFSKTFSPPLSSSLLWPSFCLGNRPF